MGDWKREGDVEGGAPSKSKRGKEKNRERRRRREKIRYVKIWDKENYLFMFIIVSFISFVEKLKLVRTMKKLAKMKNVNEAKAKFENEKKHHAPLRRAA